jgi:hypothetical protein
MAAKGAHGAALGNEQGAEAAAQLADFLHRLLGVVDHLERNDFEAARQAFRDALWMSMQGIPAPPFDEEDS